MVYMQKKNIFGIYALFRVLSDCILELTFDIINDVIRCVDRPPLGIALILEYWFRYK